MVAKPTHSRVRRTTGRCRSIGGENCRQFRRSRADFVFWSQMPIGISSRPSTKIPGRIRKTRRPI